MIFGLGGNRKGIQKLSEVTAEYVAGNLAARIDAGEYGGDLRGLATNIAAMAELVRKFTQEAQVGSSQVSAAVTQVAGAIGESYGLAETIRAEAAATRKLTDSISDGAAVASRQVEDMRSATQRMSDVAAGIYQDSMETKRMAGQGCAAVEEVSGAMRDIQQSSRDIEERIATLTQMAKEIDNFLVTIQGISSQTNLLALNASIEAARAGEHGRGFAVVAQEIQKLSDASNSAANSANGLLAQINQGIHDAVQAVNAGAASVQRGVGAMREADASLQSIARATAQVEEKLSEASQARQAQLEAAAKTRESIVRMSDQCRQAADAVGQVASSIAAQEEHLQETQRMGAVLQKVAGELEKTTGQIQLVDLTAGNRAERERQIQALQQELQVFSKQDGIAGLEARAHERLLQQLLNGHPELEAVWTNRKDGTFICSIPAAGIANGAQREWFRRAINGEQYVSSVYVSAISRQPCLTISLPIFDVAGAIVGVVGVDMKI